LAGCTQTDLNIIIACIELVPLLQIEHPARHNRQEAVTASLHRRYRSRCCCWSVGPGSTLT
jgi:hypothetical protein